MAKKSAKESKPAKKDAKAKPARTASTKPKRARNTPAPAEKQEAAAAGIPVLHALLIGCDYYLPNTTPEGSYPSLHGCVRDAVQVEEFLRKRAGLTDDRLIRLTSTPGRGTEPKEQPDSRPTYENIVAGFRTVTGRAKAGDHVYIHYSGHGGRCPTIVPKFKGTDGLDESLVPIDIGNSAARYVRDVEVAKLLREMTDKGLLVTVVFDCCHSGGATRAATQAEEQVGVRGVEFIDFTKRPAESLVGTPDELASVVAPAGRGREPDEVRGMAAVAEGGGAIVLAACRPSELAREYPFDGANAQGALTYWFLTAVAQGGDGLTFRTAYDLVYARIHGQFPTQTPMLFGEPDQPILGGVSSPADPAVPVTAVTVDGKLITLRSGLAGLTQIGVEYAVYPAGVHDLSDPKVRIAAAQVTTVRAADCTAQVTATFSTRGSQVGDRAVQVGVAQKLVRTVRVCRPDGSPTTAADKALRAIPREMKDQPWIEPAKEDSGPADFLVTTTTDGTTFQVCDPSGVALPIRPELRTDDPSAAKAVVGRLVHLSRFQALRGLDNPDPFSSLRGKVVVALFKAPPDFQKTDPLPNKLTEFPAGSVSQVKPGEWVVLSVTNRTSDVVNLLVLDLGSNWEVSTVHPDEPFHPLDGNNASWRFPLQASLPAGQKTGKDVLKVIATVDPPPPSELLTLPALDKPILVSAERVAVARSLNPLSALMEAVSADRPTRSFSTGSQPTRGWAVAHVEVEVG